MTSRMKLADMLDRYTRYYKTAEECQPYADGAFRELCRDLHGELGAWIKESQPAAPRVVSARVVRVGWGG